MEIQSIPGFQLVATTVTPADGQPPSKPNRHRGAPLSYRYRSQSETTTIDFRHGLETYVSPRLVHRPNSNQGLRKPRSKTPGVRKGNGSESKETLLDINERKKELQAMEKADLNVPQEHMSIATDEKVYVTLKCQEKVSMPSSPESTIPDPIMVCTCHGFNVVGMENKRHGDYASSEESKAWFEKILQEYEDLKKSMKAHISSTSEKNDLDADVNPRCAELFGEEVTLLDKASSNIYIMDADEVYRKNGCTLKMSRVASPTLSTYACGCPARVFPLGSPPNLDMDAVQDAAWQKMVETVAQLRETNLALQQTVKGLLERQYNTKPYDVGALAEIKTDSLQCSGMSLLESDLRKKVLGTLKSSVHRMESLMVALRDEQEKSRNLSTQLHGFLSASKDRTLQPSPPRKVS